MGIQNKSPPPDHERCKGSPSLLGKPAHPDITGKVTARRQELGLGTTRPMQEEPIMSQQDARASALRPRKKGDYRDYIAWMKHRPLEELKTGILDQGHRKGSSKGNPGDTTQDKSQSAPPADSS
jgi:hypothetical protein